MKHLALSLGLSSLLFASAGLAQIEIDGYERADLGPAYSNQGFPTFVGIQFDGGWNGSPSYLSIQDAGWGITVKGSDMMSPPPGDYKLTFGYRNGVGGMEPIQNLKVALLQDGGAKISVDLGSAAQADWTGKESAAFTLTGSPVSLEITGNTAGTINVRADFDEFYLEPITGGLPLAFTYFPDDRIYLSRTRTISVNPVGGTPPYTVDFDIGDDGSVEHSATASPYEYEWDTLVQVPQDTSRTLDLDTSNTPYPVRIKVTDSASATQEVLAEYTVDNTNDGRVSLISNGDFSQWEPADGAGNQLPVGWVEHPSALVTQPVYGPGPSYSPEAGDALVITFGVGPSDPEDRFAIHTEGIAGNYHDMQCSFWGIGTYARLYYLMSTDGGVTYATSYQDAGQANSSTWTFAVESNVQNGLGLNDPNARVAIGPHMLGTTTHAWDDISWEGKLMPYDSEVEDWNLF